MSSETKKSKNKSGNVVYICRKRKQQLDFATLPSFLLDLLACCILLCFQSQDKVQPIPTPTQNEGSYSAYYTQELSCFKSKH